MKLLKFSLTKSYFVQGKSYALFSLNYLLLEEMLTLGNLFRRSLLKDLF